MSMRFMLSCRPEELSIACRAALTRADRHFVQGAAARQALRDGQRSPEDPGEHGSEQALAPPDDIGQGGSLKHEKLPCRVPRLQKTIRISQIHLLRIPPRPLSASGSS